MNLKKVRNFVIIVLASLNPEIHSQGNTAQEVRVFMGGWYPVSQKQTPSTHTAVKSKAET